MNPSSKKFFKVICLQKEKNYTRTMPIHKLLTYKTPINLINMKENGIKQKK